MKSSFKQITTCNDPDDQIHQPLRVKFNNMYVFPHINMYIPNKLPIQIAEQPTARRPARRAKKPTARQTVQRVVQSAVIVPQPTAPQPTVQSSRAARAVRRSGRKK